MIFVHIPKSENLSQDETEVEVLCGLKVPTENGLVIRSTRDADVCTGCDNGRPKQVMGKAHIYFRGYRN